MLKLLNYQFKLLKCNWIIIDLNGRSWFHSLGTIIIVNKRMEPKRSRTQAKFSIDDWCCRMTTVLSVSDLDLILSPTLNYLYDL